MGLSYKSRKLRFYSSGIAGLALPDRLFRRRLSRWLAGLSQEEVAALLPRVNYYCRLTAPFEIGPEAVAIGDFRYEKRGTYYLDTRDIVRHFDPALRFHYQFGDIVHVCSVPTVVKSRPICRHDRQESAPNVLLKLNRVRHFQFVAKDRPQASKRPEVVWRGHCYHDNRRAMLRRFHDHPRMNVGHVHAGDYPEPGYRAPMSIEAQLRHRFILSLEGKDVATNLKWVLSSNSVCMMPEPRFETWFMEGTLKPWVHYVPLAPDCSDLEAKMEECLEQPALCEEIARNARTHVAPFLDARRERRIALLVMAKYFALSNQLTLPSRLNVLLAPPL